MRTRRLLAALLTPLLLTVTACTPDAPHKDSHPTRTVRLAGTPRARTTTPLSKASSCAQARTVLDGIQTPLGLLKQGGTPVSWTDDLRTAGERFRRLGASTAPPVGTFETGVSADLGHITAALDVGQSGTVHAVTDVLTSRISQLTYQCR